MATSAYGTASTANNPDQDRAGDIYKVPGAGRIRRKHLAVFARLMAAMLGAGMPLTQVLAALEQENEDRAFKAVIGGVKNRIEAGESLSESLAHYPEIFDELFVSMVEAGEIGGVLNNVLARLADYLEGSAKLRRQVISAMMYPVMVAIVTGLITMIMLIFMVPNFAKIYKEFDAELPAPTQVLVKISEFLRDYFLIFFGFLILSGFLFSRYRKTEGGALTLDKLKLKLPVFGELLQKMAIARFSSTFSQLVRSGVPILRSIEITSTAMGNKALGNILWETREELEAGQPLSAALAPHPEYPRVLIQMLSSGEKSGKVDEMLENISKLYEEEVESTVAGLTSLIEPLLIVILGLVVGAIIVCLFLPIFDLVNAVKI